MWGVKLQSVGVWWEVVSAKLEGGETKEKPKLPAPTEIWISSEDFDQWQAEEIAVNFLNHFFEKKEKKSGNMQLGSRKVYVDFGSVQNALSVCITKFMREAEKN